MSASDLAAARVRMGLSPPNPHKFFWHHTMLRVKDPKKSVPFYESKFGMTLIDKSSFPSLNFDLFFLSVLPDGVDKDKLPEPGTEEAHKFLWSTNHTVLELTWNYGTENIEDFAYNNGNREPHRGFGHIAFLCDDVYAASKELEAQGVKFQKKPDEGRMKGLAFVLDPDGYWVELVKRDPGHTMKCKYNLAQTMIRIKDPEKTLKFYQDHLGMSLVARKHFADAKFSLYFLASVPAGDDAKLPDPDSEHASVFMNRMFRPVLELTHNHGTENDPNFSYHNGNVEPKGFGHIAFLCDDVDKACQDLAAAGVEFVKKPSDGKMKGIAFCKDPDGYWVEIIPRGIHIELSP